MAPSYTNIFMGKLETELLWLVSERAVVWWRCIHDVFAIWAHDEESLQVYLNELNLFHCTIKFIAEWSREFITFLDTRMIREGNHVITDLYTKPPDTHQYLHQHSCHHFTSKQVSPTVKPLEYTGSAVRRTITNDEWTS